MLSLIALCLIIYFGTYFCIKESGQSTEVTPIQSFEDYFFHYGEKGRKVNTFTRK